MLPLDGLPLWIFYGLASFVFGVLAGRLSGGKLPRYTLYSNRDEVTGPIFTWGRHKRTLRRK